MTGEIVCLHAVKAYRRRFLALSTINATAVYRKRSEAIPHDEMKDGEVD
jgi:hypothetical protein